MKKYFFIIIMILVFFSWKLFAQNNDNQTENIKSQEVQDEQENWGIGAHPIIGYDSHSSLTIGAGAVIYFEPEDKNQDLDEIELITSYNLTNQYDMMVNCSKYLKNNICCINSQFGYQNYPDDYNDMDYDAVFFPFEVGASFNIYDKIYFGPLYKFEYSDTRFKNNNFANETISGAGEKYLSGLGGQIIYKNIPRGQYYRREGNILTISSIYYSHTLRSSSEFYTINMDYCHYFPVCNESVLAFQIAAKSCQGDVPFYDILNLEGKGILRGASSMSGKYFLAGQTEFRFPVYKRIGAALFIGAGEVKNTIGDFNSDIGVAGGIGMRIKLNKAKNINLRFDFAYNDDSEKSIYIKIKEAF